ncbi:phosphoribosyltransferase family protein [Streptantibioticus rubrisoli]|uniref:Dienelactone hydrolase family protein n=1 Tax=Streptantibioticus rubrisoli TaxID=1387313 RepID=A0ABT1P797_9ACTN|nr:phosphoribosyltransferase family protein [Streptantibioticus rubrisoli]MCQ4041225.1 dienelactone hydrolase family protein [Streptantibioticus rubrisoli]
MYFYDRLDAGRRLAERLAHLRGTDVAVLGLPRGGVPVAAQVAEALGAPLDVCVVRKLGAPFQPELAMGAIGEGGVRVINDEVVGLERISQEELAEVEERERAELARRAARYRGDRPRLDITGRTVIVIDDGIATGATARAACRIARAQGAKRVILAVPVAPPDRIVPLGQDVDELVCLETPHDFFGVGQFYADFSQTSDAEVMACLARSARRGAGSASAPSADPGPYDYEVEVRAGSVSLEGRLTAPEGAAGMVVFAHGSGSSRHSPRNRLVAGELNRAGLATLLFDLLTRDEEVDRANVFDTVLLARRLTDTTRWLRERPEARGLPVGYFGASTGAAAALWAAAEPEARICAVVSRGGRPDLAGPRLSAVTSPTLLIVGGADPQVLDLNRQAQARMRCESRLAVVPGATHLFEEEGTLERAAELAKDWFLGHLASAPGAAAG